MDYGGKNDDIIYDVTWPWKLSSWPQVKLLQVISRHVTLTGQCRDRDNFKVHYLDHGLRCRLDSVTMGHLQEITKYSKYICKNCSLSPS